MNTESQTWSELVPVIEQSYRTHELFMNVSGKFYATLLKFHYKLCKIYRVQNLDLWHKYQKYVSADYVL